MGSLDLWRVPVTPAASPALPGAEDCLKVTVTRRSRAGLRRDGKVRVALRSDAGDERAHRLRVRVETSSGRTLISGTPRALRLRRAGARRLTLRLPRRAIELLERSATAWVVVTAEQRLGSGNRTTTAAYGGAGMTFKAARR